MKHSVLIILICVFISCSKTPEPINYGTDMCHYCKMTIVTKTHAAQMVNSKGKQYKFDAIECMIRFLDDKPDIVSESNLLVTDYNSPGTMIDAKKASYIISEKITSPMGANLTGFNSMDAAKEVINSTSAAYFDWEGIFKQLN